MVYRGSGAASVGGLGATDFRGGLQAAFRASGLGLLKGLELWPRVEGVIRV